MSQMTVLGLLTLFQGCTCAFFFIMSERKSQRILDLEAACQSQSLQITSLKAVLSATNKEGCGENSVS